MALTLLLAALAPFYVAAARNHRALRYLLTPTNVPNRFAGLWKGRTQPPAALIPGGADALRPLLVVLVFGETARAANFSLGRKAEPAANKTSGPGLCRAGYFNPALKILIFVGDAIICRSDRYDGLLRLTAAITLPPGAARRRHPKPSSC